MARYDRCDRPRCGRSRTVPSPSGRRYRSAGAGGSGLTLVRGSEPDAAPVELSRLTGAPMPASVRGALVTVGRGRLLATWMPRGDSARVPAGRVLLSWTPADEGRSDVTAHLGLPGAQVLLAVWPGLCGEWSGVVRPTVVEVTQLHAALRLATRALELLTD